MDISMDQITLLSFSPADFNADSVKIMINKYFGEIKSHGDSCESISHDSNSHENC